MSEFWAMDGYAAYVWSAWGISAFTLIALAFWSLRERSAAKARLQQLEDDEA